MTNSDKDDEDDKDDSESDLDGLAGDEGLSAYQIQRRRNIRANHKLLIVSGLLDERDALVAELRAMGKVIPHAPAMKRKQTTTNSTGPSQ